MPDNHPQAAKGVSMDNARICDSFVDPGNKSTLMGATRITGSVSGPGDLVLDGELHGDVTITGLLVIGENGALEGKVNAGNVVLAGRVKGRVMARERVEIRASGRLEGNVVCQKIAIAEGASLDGEVHTHKGKVLDPDVFTEKRKDLKLPTETSAMK
jgi:cytoskeletal protein CcmA (bactofilin family)